MNTKRIQRFAELELLRRDLAAQLERTKAQIAKIDTAIISDMTDALIPSVPIEIEHNGAKRRVSIYVQTQLWAKAKPGVDMSALQAALIEEELPDLVKLTAHSGTLSSYVRECLADDCLPETIENLIETTTRISLRSRVSNASQSATDRAEAATTKGK